MINNKEGATVQILIASLSRLSLKGYPFTMRINSNVQNFGFWQFGWCFRIKMSY